MRQHVTAKNKLDFQVAGNTFLFLNSVDTAVTSSLKCANFEARRGIWPVQVTMEALNCQTHKNKQYCVLASLIFYSYDTNKKPQRPYSPPRGEPGPMMITKRMAYKEQEKGHCLLWVMNIGRNP